MSPTRFARLLLAPILLLPSLVLGQELGTDEEGCKDSKLLTRMPGCSSSASASHSVSHSGLAPPLTLATIQSGWYFEERGNCLEINRLSEAIESTPLPDDLQSLRLSLHGRESAVTSSRR